MNARTALQLLAVLPTLVFGEFTSLQLTKCGTDSVIQIDRVAVTPMPVEIPGTIQLSVDGSLKRSVGSSSLTVSMKRQTFLGLEIPIPCLLNVGSCTYNDICVLVDRMITENWAGIAGGIGTQLRDMFSSYNINASQCPQPAQDLHINSYTITLPEVPSVLSWFAEGDYHINVKVNENASGQEIMCLDLQLTIKQHVDGQGGWFIGRRKRNTRK